MKGFIKDITELATENTNFREVLYTAKHCQLVLMSLKPGEEIGMEMHSLDQFFRVEQGDGEAVIDGVHTSIREGYAILVPSGTEHNIINNGKMPLKLYSVYAPPIHRDGVVHQAYADAAKDHEHFDGKLTERRIPITGEDTTHSIPISIGPRRSLRFSSASTART